MKCWEIKKGKFFFCCLAEDSEQALLKAQKSRIWDRLLAEPGNIQVEEMEPHLQILVAVKKRRRSYA